MERASETESVIEGASTVPVADCGPMEGSLFWELIRPEAIDPLWERVRPFLYKSIAWSPEAQKLEGVDDIRKKCLAGIYQAWVCIENNDIAAVLVTQVTEHSRCSVLDIHYGAGEGMEKWIPPLLESIIADIRASGCRFIRVIGRHGWKDALKKIGFGEAASIYMMEL